MRQLFEELFPAWPTPLLSDETLETFASRPNAKLPQFSYCGPELHWHGHELSLAISRRAYATTHPKKNAEVIVSLIRETDVKETFSP